VFNFENTDTTRRRRTRSASSRVKFDDHPECASLPGFRVKTAERVVVLWIVLSPTVVFSVRVSHRTGSTAKNQLRLRAQQIFANRVAFYVYETTYPVPVHHCRRGNCVRAKTCLGEGNFVRKMSKITNFNTSNFVWNIPSFLKRQLVGIRY